MYCYQHTPYYLPETRVCKLFFLLILLYQLKKSKLDVCQSETLIVCNKLKGDKMDSFLINEFQVIHKKKILFSAKFDDSALSSPLNSIYTTVIIGENGCGKSYLLSVIASFFQNLDLHLNSTKRVNFRYENYFVKYLIDGYEYVVDVKNNEPTFFKNGKIISKDKVILPTKVISISYTVEDKFSFTKNDENQIYSYGGVRTSSNSTFINSSIKSIIEQIIYHINDVTFKEQLGKILEFIGFSKKIQIVYESAINWKNQSSPNKAEKIEEIFERNLFNDYRQGKVRKFFNTFSKDDIIYKYFDMVDQDNKYVIEFYLEENAHSLVDFIENYDFIDGLVSARLLKSPQIKFYKDDIFDYADASSGEKQILNTFVRIASYIKGKSLILIDEPELSLHPKWQSQYVETLKKIFSESYNSHVIIATHSHYLVSDLRPESSSLCHMRMEGKNRIIESLDYSTYGWSAENILYNVFRMRTARNMYFAKDLQELMTLVEAKSKNIDLITERKQKLKGYLLNEEDPLNQLIKEVEVYLYDLQ